MAVPIAPIQPLSRMDIGQISGASRVNLGQSAGSPTAAPPDEIRVRSATVNLTGHKSIARDASGNLMGGGLLVNFAS